MIAAAGVDIGGTKIAAGLVSGNGELLDLRTEPTDTSTPMAPARQVAALVRSLAGDSTLAGIGVGVPGLPHVGGDRVWAPNLPGWERFPLGAMLGELFPGLPIAVENDGKCAALGEAWVGAGQGTDSAVLIIIGTGIGGGVVVNGRVVRGHHGVAGALGWMPVGEFAGTQHTGPLIGPLERAAAGPALDQAAATLGLGKAADLFAAARSGHSAAMQAVDRFSRLMAQAIAALTTVVDPDVVILGGGVSGNFTVFEAPLQAHLRQLRHPFAGELRVVAARLAATAGVIGAARLILHP